MAQTNGDMEHSKGWSRQSPDFSTAQFPRLRSLCSGDETDRSFLIAETPDSQPVEKPTNGEQVEGQQEEESSGGMSYPRYPGWMVLLIVIANVKCDRPFPDLRQASA